MPDLVQAEEALRLQHLVLDFCGGECLLKMKRSPLQGEIVTL